MENISTMNAENWVVWQDLAHFSEQAALTAYLRYSTMTVRIAV